MNIIDNDLLSIQEARILAENACFAQQELATFSQERLDSIVEAMADEISKHTKELAIMSAEETDFGNWEDKFVKNNFVSNYLRRALRGVRCVGVIKEDRENGILDIGVPIGVIAAVCPATSPVSTTIYKVLISIKSGNAIVFSPHPRGKEVISKTLDIMIEAGQKAGLPEGAVSYLNTVTKSGTIELMKHECVTLNLLTGVPAMLDIAYQAQKPIIFGGAGNGPVFIERTADLKKAVRDIVASKTFDNGIVPAAEQSIVVDGYIDREVKEEFIRNNCYFMTNEESKALANIFFTKTGKPNLTLVGTPAHCLAKAAGFSVPQGTKLLISEEKFASQENPYTREKLGPVVAYFVEDDWMHACEKCIELLLTEREGHTLTIHSKDEAVIQQFAIKKPVGRVLVNTPATFGSMGATTNLFPAMTLGSGSAGKGITSDNVSPMNLIYIRKVGFGVRDLASIAKHQSPNQADEIATGNDMENMELIQEAIIKAFEQLGKKL